MRPPPNPDPHFGAAQTGPRAEGLVGAATEWAAALQRVEGRQARLLRRLIPYFLVECPQLMAAIRQAIVNADAPQLRYAAHTLKGSVAFLADQTVTEVVQQLETMGENGTLAGAEEVYTTLETLMGALLPVLADFAKTQVPDELL
jgi:HPt (histidine-containing phosphotransfer) domain-containing protein